MRILWLKSELLHPVDKGGKIRTYEMLKELKREHHITYLSLDDGAGGPDAVARAEEYCHELVRIPHQTQDKFTPGFYADLVRNIVSPLPYTLMKYKSQQMQSEVGQRCAERSFDVLVCDFLTPAVNIPWPLEVLTVLFQHNVEAMLWQRHFEMQTHPLKKWFVGQQWRKLRDYEGAACHRFDEVIAVSREDAETMRRDYRVDTVMDVATGVATDYFKPNPDVQREPGNIVFVGSMDWLPNDDAMRFFTEAVLPRIRLTLPSVTLTIVGRNPYPHLMELSRRDPSVRVTGRVDDVRSYIDSAAVYVVPIRIGGGTRLKIYEAMAMEKPIVSTTIGAEGLPVHHNEELIFADTPDAFADAVVSLLKNENEARQLGLRAAKTVREQFGWNRVARDFSALCEDALERYKISHKKTNGSLDGTSGQVRPVSITAVKTSQ